MKFLAVTGALFIALIGAIFAVPLLNTILDFETNSALAESVFLSSPVEEISEVDTSQAEFSAE
ncbi:MAG: hypothetical protein N2D54_05430, partial [Chloroflexota bacterium]